MLQEQASDQHLPQMSYSQLDPYLEEKLNDIDEFIQSKLELECLNPGGQPPTTGTNQLSHSWPSHEVVLGSLNPESAVSDFKPAGSSNKPVPDVEVEVQIMDLKDVYNKKTKKTLDGLEYPLEESIVNVVIEASDEITSVQAYVRRCPDAAIKTHDTIGAIEVGVTALQSDLKRRTVCVDLGSVYKTKDGQPVYWLEKADVMQRNKWELIIVVKFISGLTGEVTSKPFRVTTKVAHKRRGSGESDASSCIVQRLFRKISGSNILPCLIDHEHSRRPKLLTSSSGVKEGNVCASSEEMKPSSSLVGHDSSSHIMHGSKLNVECWPLGEERIMFQPNTVLDRHAVTNYYGGEQMIDRVVEQPEIPGLLKLVVKNSNPAFNASRKANGHKTTDEDYWWACGVCFFQRRKKSTIKDHVIRRVCLKSIKNKKSKGIVVKRQLQSRHTRKEKLKTFC